MFFTFQSFVFVGQPVLDIILTEEINIFITIKIKMLKRVLMKIKTRCNNDDIFVILIND